MNDIMVDKLKEKLYIKRKRYFRVGTETRIFSEYTVLGRWHYGAHGRLIQMKTTGITREYKDRYLEKYRDGNKLKWRLKQ